MAVMYRSLGRRKMWLKYWYVAVYMVTGTFDFEICSSTNLKMSLMSSSDSELPRIYLSKSSGMSPRTTLCFPIRALYRI